MEVENVVDVSLFEKIGESVGKVGYANTHIHTYIHTHIYIYIHTHTYTYIHTHITQAFYWFFLLIFAIFLHMNVMFSTFSTETSKIITETPAKIKKKYSFKIVFYQKTYFGSKKHVNNT